MLRHAHTLSFLIALVLSFIVTRPARAIELTPAEVQNPRCLNCHAKPEMATMPPEERRTQVAGTQPADAPKARPGIHLDPATLGSSVHSKLSCVDCHSTAKDLPHPIRLGPAQCVSCHADQQAQYSASVHGKAVAGGSKQAAHCTDCHGSHDIISRKNPQSRVYRVNLPFTCAKCHSNAKLTEDARIRQPHAAEQYIDSMHGRALMLTPSLAPTCNNCHGVHEILPASDLRSSVNRAQVPKTCGKCHTLVESVYRESIHGQMVSKGNDKAPVCVTCHTAHEITKPGDAPFKLHSDARCGQCHADRLERYRETFHGKAIALGRAGVAACYDCHGHHEILPNNNPKSHLAGENKLSTCQHSADGKHDCHVTATAKFASYLPHADHSDRANYPVLYWTFIFMTCIVLGTFAFFGVHSASWFFRSLALLIRDPKAFKEARAAAAKGEEEFVRFRPFERFLHFLVIVSFLTLVATGMPLKFYETQWAKWMVNFMGGLQVAGRLHRIGAAITFLYFALHLASMAKAGWKRRADFRNPKTGRFSPIRFAKVALGPDLPIPNLEDAKEWWAHQKWFFGRGPRPQFDRWTYWEKFDYMAVFWGVSIIGVSGLIMWFPTFFTRFMPGWVINVALIVHSDEALLAAGFIFTFHFFNVHFRLEKFPMDPVIFSGRMSKTEMMHERKRWYDRLVAAGELDKVKVKDEWAQWKRVMHPVGFMAFLIGLALLVLIFVAMSARLFAG